MPTVTTSGSNGKTERGRGGRQATHAVTSLASLAGGHPGTLRTYYLGGRPADPADLGDAPHGRLLAFEPGQSVFMLTRSFLQGAAGSDLFPWRGKTFDHGGNSGQNRLYGRHAFRFRTEVAPSSVDGQPTLLLSYDDPAFKNPWPVRAIRDELRTIAPGLAIGPAYYRGSLLLWWGLERDR
jgi:hypothetical protein